MIMKLGDRMQYLSFGKHFYLLVVFLVTAAPPVLHACVLELGELVSAVTSPGLQQNLPQHFHQRRHGQAPQTSELIKLCTIFFSS